MTMNDKPEVSEFGSVDPAPPASNDQTVEKLRETLCDEQEKMFQRMRALFALRNIGGKPAVDSLADAFESSSALLKHEIAYVLGQMQDDNAVPYLIERLEDLEEDVTSNGSSTISKELAQNLSRLSKSNARMDSGELKKTGPPMILIGSTYPWETVLIWEIHG